MRARGTLEVLRVSWQSIQDCYNIVADLPGWDIILHGVDLSAPEQAANTILVNLLTEAMELVDRFNPWYKAPAEAYGLHFAAGWRLKPEATERWRPTLKALARAIANDAELQDIQATVEATDWLTHSLVPATCCCEPSPPIVWVPPYTTLEATLICDICGQPLHRIEQRA